MRGIHVPPPRQMAHKAERADRTRHLRATRIIMGEKLDVENTLAFMGYNLTHNMKIYKAKADTKDYKINIQSILET